jgi:hypothetical protein
MSISLLLHNHPILFAASASDMKTIALVTPIQKSRQIPVFLPAYEGSVEPCHNFKTGAADRAGSMYVGGDKDKIMFTLSKTLGLIQA